MNPFNTDDDLFSVFEERSTTPVNNKKRKGLDEAIQEENERAHKKLKKNVNVNINEESVTSEQNETKIEHQHATSVSITTQELNKEESTISTLIGHLTSNSDCLHDVALPPDYTGEDPLTTKIPDRKPAKEYPFTLDAFQREAVIAIEKGQSVLVSAHTSAGKTAVAEYAIAASLRDGSRVVYTSPIKALSNQKYRELAEEFKDVGLMTGDVTISPNASCIVMTTEILRSMLYRGSELLNEVAWVIFDEVHYMRDKERGVVWEETLILLPNTVRYVFLSATIPNALEFAAWIAKLKGQPVHVVYTDYRPTPLQHYVYPSGGEGIHLVVDEKAQFREENWNKAIMDLQSKKQMTGTAGKQRGSDRLNKQETGNVQRIVQMIMKKNFQPVIVFSFSRKDCESHALQTSKMDLNDENEMALVEEVFTNAIDSLSDDDKRLPQVEHMLPLLKKGIGIHHSGLLPIIKEVIEILFQEGLVKVLFSTETFSMGLNMPARTVVFTSVEKFDGEVYRKISSGEYIQMSGRAGRRGIDDRGIIIMMMEEEMEVQVARQMMSGKPDRLNSSFHLSYYMILNLLRVEEITPEYIMERSFYQYQSERQRPQLEQELEQVEKQRDQVIVENERQVQEYYDARRELESLRDQIRLEITKPIYAIPYLQPGRLVRVRDGQDDWGWGVVINYQKKKSAESANVKQTKASDYIVDVLLKCQPMTKGDKSKPKPWIPNSTEKPNIAIIPIELELIDQFSTVRVYLNKNLKTEESREIMLVRMNEVERRFQDEQKGKSSTSMNTSSAIPLLDPVEDMGIKTKTLPKLIEACEAVEARIAASELSRMSQDKVRNLLEKYRTRCELQEKANDLRKRIKDAGQLVLKEELKKRMRVLRRLGCISQDNVIQLKGRVACEISAGDELVITEMIFNGAFNDLTSEQCVSVLSCMTFGEGSSKQNESTLPEELRRPYQELLKAVQRVIKVSQESKVELDPEQYQKSFSPDLMQVTYAWCMGAKFYDICKMTEVFEGSIVRVMRRLEELIRQICAAAKAIGDDSLEKKLLDGITKLKRDIVFSSSLYL
jgi:ATP-dependent RNA helicase DOB1